MPVASVTEISATSTESFEEATLEGLTRAERTLRGIQGAWVKDMNVLIDNGSLTGYKVNLPVTFVIEEAQGGTASGVALRTSTSSVRRPCWSRGSNRKAPTRTTPCPRRGRIPRSSRTRNPRYRGGFSVPSPSLQNGGRTPFGTPARR